MADILPGYSFVQSLGRYRDLQTGKFVGRANITALSEAHVADAERRYAELTTAFAEKRIDAASWVVSIRDEQRRLTLINEALGGGGIAQLDNRNYGRSGNALRDQYARITANATQFQAGEITEAQLQARMNAMIGEARGHFWTAERESARPQNPDNVLIERRIAESGNRCADCQEYYDMGWQHMNTLPPPSQGSVCGGNCRCRLERREVPFYEVDEWIGTKN